jgi:glycosyltransferase involved in cell wall biosynthesis
VEEDVVAEAAIRYSSPFDRAPPAYWDNWREECAIANDIIVNSAWSRECLLRAGIPQAKIKIVPLAYKNPHAGPMSPHNYPSRFSPDRPLRVLFLGQITVRKGAIELLNAAHMMKAAPVVFQIAGPDQLSVGPELLKSTNVQFIGTLPRSSVAKYYSEADIFILPTLSDGFGLTQIEAQSYGLPVLASRYCGEVVRDNENGRIIHPITPDRICHLIGWCLDHPGELREMSICALKRCEAYRPSLVVDTLAQSVEGTC